MTTWKLARRKESIIVGLMELSRNGMDTASGAQTMIAAKTRVSICMTAETPPDQQEVQQEIGGPSQHDHDRDHLDGRAVVIAGANDLHVADLDQAIACANDSEYGLAWSIFTQNLGYTMRTINEIDFGEIYVNRWYSESINGFHQRLRKSGLGGDDGKYGFEEYMASHTC